MDDNEYRYNYTESVLEILWEMEVIDAIDLSVHDWNDGPEEWVNRFHDEIQSELNSISLYV